MSKTDAAYMRAYRARKKAERAPTYDLATLNDVAERLARNANDSLREIAPDPFQERIAELEEEVRHLKEELAKRPPASIVLNAADFHQVQRIAQSPGADGRYSTRPFTPVPKRHP